MEDREMVEFLIQERVGLYINRHGEQRTKEWQEFELWKQRLEEKFPEIAVEFQDYMNRMALNEGSDQEGLYMHGFRDGVKLMKEIMKI